MACMECGYPGQGNHQCSNGMMVGGLIWPDVGTYTIERLASAGLLNVNIVKRPRAELLELENKMHPHGKGCCKESP